MMRVTHVITRLIVGGAQENTVSTVLGLHQYPDVEVDLISGPTSGAEGSLEPLLTPLPGLLSILPTLVRPIRPYADFVALRSLTRRFQAQKPDIVHTHSGKAGVVGRLAARRAGVPLVIHTVHGPSFGTFQNRWTNYVFLHAEKKAALCTTHFISVAEAMTLQYLAAGIGKPEQFTRILSGFALERFLVAQNDPALRAQYGIAPGDIVIGKLGRLFKLKGHEDLLAAAPDILRQIPNAKFLLVGDGPWRNRFEALTRKLGLSTQVIFAGLVRPEEVPRLVGMMDILVHLSSREGLPRALPQALAAGKPVVAYDCDGAGEVCFDGKTGFLIAPGNKIQLVRRIVELGQSPALREQLGQQGRAFVREQFAESTMVENIYMLYQKLCAEKKRTGRARGT